MNGRVLGEVVAGWLESGRTGAVLGTIVAGGGTGEKVRPVVSVLVGEGAGSHPKLKAWPVVLRGEWLPKVAGGGGTPGAVDAGEFEAGFAVLGGLVNGCCDAGSAGFRELRLLLAAEGLLLRRVVAGRVPGSGEVEGETGRRVEAGWVMWCQVAVA